MFHELIPPCGAGRREKVGALYSTVSELLASSAEHTLDSFLVLHRIYSPGSSEVIVGRVNCQMLCASMNTFFTIQEIHPHSRAYTRFFAPTSQNIYPWH